MIKALASFIAMTALIAAIGGSAYLAHEAGRNLGEATMLQRWEVDRRERAEKLAAAIAAKRELERQRAEDVAEIRLSHREFINEAEKRAESAVRDADLRNHRLQRAFDACANTVDVLGDAEAAARADAEGFADALGRVHEFHVRQYTRADKRIDQLNRVIDYQEAANGTD